jgi:phosphoribosylformimino-5-aminoimidazole carboxamide ribonucleotide (ProFAR) isomerase
VGFEVIPAIEVAAGRLARPGPDGPVPVGTLGGDPIEAAWRFQEAGARWLHLVHLDRQLDVAVENLDEVRAVADLPVRVQVGEGIVSPAEVDAAKEAGAARIVLGSAALFDRPLTEFLIAVHGERVAVGLEAVGDVLMPLGATDGRTMSLEDALAWLVPAGPSRFVVTEVGRVGPLTGADLEGPALLAERTGIPAIVDGSVASLADLTALARRSPLVEGAIVGRALYDRVDLAEVIRAVERSQVPGSVD